jgi:hypothetical protein
MHLPWERGGRRSDHIGEMEEEGGERRGNKGMRVGKKEEETNRGGVCDKECKRDLRPPIPDNIRISWTAVSGFLSF